MAKIITLPDGKEAEFPDNMDNAAIEAVLKKQFAPQVTPVQQAARDALGPSDFTRSFASTPARMLKSGMQMVGAGDYVPEFVSNAAAEGDKSLPGRIAGDVVGTGGIRSAGVGLARTLEALNAAKGIAPALGRTAEAATYGAAQGAITSPDQQGQGAAWGAAGGAAAPVLGGALKASGHGIANVTGMTTGAGAESMKQAFRDAPGFVENMRGTVEPGVVVAKAREGLQNMRNTMNDAYRQNKQVWASGQQPLDFAPVEKAYNDMVASTQFKGASKIAPADRRVLDQAGAVIDEWKVDPQLHTAEGMDALKQRLRNIYPESPEHSQSRRIVEGLAGSVRNEISKQNPAYAEAMKHHSVKMDQLDEIERSLALGDRNTIDNALRKLQSITRGGGSGQRLKSAEILSDEGGNDVLPAIAGQDLSSWTPRGLQRYAASIGGGFSIANPAFITALPVFSPRIAGEATRAAGQVVNNPASRATIEALRRSAPAISRSVGEE